MTHSAMLFYAIVGGAFIACLIVLAAMFIRRLRHNRASEEPYELDTCYECGGYGDDYYINDDGELVSACDDCPLRERRGATRAKGDSDV